MTVTFVLSVGVLPAEGKALVSYLLKVKSWYLSAFFVLSVGVLPAEGKVLVPVTFLCTVCGCPTC